MSVATSGDERRYARTLDPHRAPVTRDLVSLTVAADDCMTADAAATALVVLGPDEGPAFAAEHRLAARFVRFDGRYLNETLSPALVAMLD